MKSAGTLLVCYIFCATTTVRALTIADQGQVKCGVVIDNAATAAERRAAQELAQTLQKITGGEFAVKESGHVVPAKSIFVGSGAAARTMFPEVVFERVGLMQVPEPSTILLALFGVAILALTRILQKAHF